MAPPTYSLRSATDDDIPALLGLWDICGLSKPHNHGPTDIAFARRGPNSDVLVLDVNGKTVASVMVGHDGHRGWVYYVAVHPDHQRQEIGTRIMAHAEEWLRGRGIWKMQLLVRASNAAVAAFYAKLGFTKGDVTVLSKALLPMPHINTDAPAS